MSASPILTAGRVARPLGLSLLAGSLGLPALAVDNLLVNRGFEDTDVPADGTFGDGWASFGAAGYNAFFGANGHASLFGDRNTNIGSVFQLGIAGAPGTTYQFDLLNTRIESAWDASLRFGLEYYLADDATKIGESIATIDTAARLALPNVDGGGAANGAVFSVQGTAVPGTAIVRPVVLFDNVNPTYPGDTGPGQPQANAFVFDSFLSEVPTPGGNLLKNPGFEDIDGDGNLGAVWGSFGTVGFNDFFSAPGSPNGHASLFADTVGNEGGLFQQSILGTPGTDYTFALTDVRIEDNWDADLTFGLEYYGDDDFNKLGETLVVADTDTPGDGQSFEVTGTAVAGTKYVRPVVLFGNVNPGYLEQPLANLFIFDTSLAQAVSELAGDYNDSGLVEQGDLDQVLANWGAGFASIPASWINQRPTEGIVDQAELDVVLTQWGSSAAPDFAGSTVPEPAALAMLGGLGLIARRRRS